ncbi:MAG: hypothetical protein WC570_03965 [Patescibacteria group bacterium]
MKITNIPNYIAWWNQLGEKKNLLEMVGKNTRRKIKQLLQITEENDLRMVVEEATDELAAKFFNVYKNFISSQKSGKVYDVLQIIREKNTVKKYKFLSLYYRGEYRGGLLFSGEKGKIATAFKCYPHQIEGLKLPIGIAYLSDYYLVLYAAKNNLARINHGRDRNIYGVNSNPGLAMYKLTVGCKPFVSKARDVEWVDFVVPDKNDRDILIFQASTKGEPIKQATLILFKTRKEEIPQVYGALKNITDLQLEVIDRKTVLE